MDFVSSFNQYCLSPLIPLTPGSGSTGTDSWANSPGVQGSVGATPLQQFWGSSAHHSFIMRKWCYHGEISPDKTKEYFYVNRAAHDDALLHVAQGKQFMLIEGHRQSGKSTCGLHAKQLLTDNGYTCIWWVACEL